MDKILIVGSGFSAALVYSYLSKYDVRIISPSIGRFLPNNIDIKEDFVFNYNKILSKKASSYSTLNIIKSPKIRLHNRIIDGGNSAIWGGFYDVDLDFNVHEQLKKIGASLKRLSLNNTGSIANKDSIYQLTGSNGLIYNSNSFLGNKIENSYLIRLIPGVDSVLADEYNPLANKIIRNKYSRVYVCCGVLNSISILAKSFSVSNFKLDDYEHRLGLCNLYSRMESNENLKIRYRLMRAVNHYLGIQKKFDFINSKYFKIGIEQTFSNKPISVNLTIKNNIDLFLSSDSNEFGSSIHYNNLSVNGATLDNFSSSISQNIKFFGMAGVKQIKPGPISNDIHQHIHDYFVSN